ncbi:MAG TPA: SDR family oxidoreductase [Burkholderiaceae bacterium]|nr:SDR family oxidoreductase [Burkholderiaceae bacterium]
MTVSHDFSGRRVLVAGGSRGIGRGIALAFARAGASVSICARGADALEEARREIAAAGAGTAHAQVCDLADDARIRAWVEAAATALGGIDVLVNNASGFGAGDTEDGWATSLGVDVQAVVRASRAALPWLERGVSPSVINLSSISALRPSTRTPAYGAAKAAVVHYTASQAAMWSRKGIRVNSIAPGSIEFPGGVWDQRRRSDPKLYERIVASIPFGRLGTVEEVADVALFLASDAARWVTGQTLAVDGGQILGA